MIELIGYAAAVLTTACYVPQALHIIRTRHTRSISLGAYSLLALGVVCWLIYGICTHDWPIIMANGCTIILVGIILVMKIRLG